ncbi:SDR family oxidoreductase [Simiduia sp. 21SJ11W-1]|uniref:SDR family oxidoreductase n=1 Tax=Simiduia sp. 21SJ11W-1 TaxID=2909669 RepID=UPI0020A1DC30|nr:SDR family oxidoreductase [Simiduia sp. 21SJ11W-1]UTA46902.1 SDR family oxidoreductase [Simiduia sp. 21SJ11W-1]
MHTVITGANRGIGLALTRCYLAAGHKVSAVCRQASDELRATDARIIDQVDVTQPQGIEQLQKALAGEAIDLLINNAGLLVGDQLGELPWGDIERQFAVNTLGPLRVTQALLANLGQGAKVALITSRMGSVADNGSGGYYGYRMSKAALNIAGKSLAIDLKPKGVAVALLHPGFVQTAMVNHNGDISADEAASRLVKRIEALTLENSGGFWHSNGEALPW